MLTERGQQAASPGAGSGSGAIQFFYQQSQGCEICAGDVCRRSGAAGERSGLRSCQSCWVKMVTVPLNGS